MNEKLIKILKKYSLEDIIKIEESDRQFLALKMLYENISNIDVFLSLIITNALLSYQLSSTGEEYWEEFAIFASEWNFGNEYNLNEIKDFFIYFLSNSKGNKRLLNMKMIRFEKIMSFLEKIIGKEEYFYEHMLEFRSILAKTMKQKDRDKTIVFCVKMFSYGARIHYDRFISVPFEIEIPMDSRIIKITKIYNDTDMNPYDFWNSISKKSGIPPIHLDTLLWIRCQDFICI